MTEVLSYRELTVWQRSVELACEIYSATGLFPPEELYGLVSQMRRAAVSIPSNIAEGSRRNSKKDFRKFVCNAFGSGAELETQVLLAKRLSFGKEADFVKIEALLDEVMRMLNVLVRSLG